MRFAFGLLLFVTLAVNPNNIMSGRIRFLSRVELPVEVQRHVLNLTARHTTFEKHSDRRHVPSLPTDLEGCDCVFLHHSTQVSLQEIL